MSGDHIYTLSSPPDQTIMSQHKVIKHLEDKLKTLTEQLTELIAVVTDQAEKIKELENKYADMDNRIFWKMR
jgi:type VII secretion effector (TIGR04197 family)